MQKIEYPCKIDATMQPAFVHFASADAPRPLLVALHTWSYDENGDSSQYGAFCKENDWNLRDKHVGPAWAILQLLCYCAFVVILAYAAKLFLPGVSAWWLILPILAAALLGNFALAVVTTFETSPMRPTSKVVFYISFSDPHEDRAAQ